MNAGDIDSRLAEHHNDYAEAQLHINDCLELAADVSRIYAGCDDQTRRLCNQAFFTKIYIDEDNVMRPVLAEPFNIILDPDKAREAHDWSAKRAAAPNESDVPAPSIWLQVGTSNIKCAFLDDVRISSRALRSLISRASTGIETDRPHGRRRVITDQRGPVAQSIEKPRNTVTGELVEQMRQLYESCRSLKQVAENVSVNRGTVTHHLRKSGVQFRNQGLDEDGLAKARQRYFDGETLAQIGAVLGVSPTTVGSYLRGSGVMLRPSRAVAGVRHSRQNSASG